jgi:divalent anion:Na+ symporter, DASS family
MTNSTGILVKSSYPLSIGGNIKLIKLLLVIGLALLLWFGVQPEGLSSQAWHLLTIFICTIAAMIAKVLPTGSLAIIAITACSATQTVSLENSIASFGSKIVWLVVCAFILAKGFTKTGLGSRIAYYFVYLFGKNTVGLSYSLIITELFLSPLIPSNTARGAGIMFPIASAISKEFNSNALGALLMKICFHTNVITSAMFLTASAANPLITSISKNFGYELTWLVWAKAAIVPGLLSLIILPFILFFFFPGALKKTEEVQAFAKQQIKNSGPLKAEEWIMLFTFFLLLILWVTSSLINLDATVSAFIGLTVLLITEVLTWNDIVSEKEAWTTFIWLATLLMLAGNLEKLGTITWISNQIHAQIMNYRWETGLLLLCVVYFSGHYLLATLTAHVSAMYAAFCSISIMLGAPAPLTVLVFAGISNFSSCITHYTTGAAPLFFGANYISMAKWWKIGLTIGIINSIIWLIVGGWWWKCLGIF